MSKRFVCSEKNLYALLWKNGSMQQSVAEYIYAGGDIDEVGWYMIVLNRDL